jgi:hypothetical protein
MIANKSIKPTTEMHSFHSVQIFITLSLRNGVSKKLNVISKFALGRVKILQYFVSFFVFVHEMFPI